MVTFPPNNRDGVGAGSLDRRLPQYAVGKPRKAGTTVRHGTDDVPKSTEDARRSTDDSPCNRWAVSFAARVLGKAVCDRRTRHDDASD